MRKIKKICFDKCEATVLSERELTTLPDGREVKLVLITPFEGEDPYQCPIFCSYDKVYLVYDRNIMFIHEDILNFVLWHEVGHIYHCDCHYQRDDRNEYVEDRADEYARTKVDTSCVSYEDVRVFCFWFGNAFGKPECITEEFINDNYRRIKNLP